MTTLTSIEWTEQTWNPTTGCTKISLGCQNCYAEIMARRLQAMGVRGYEKGFSLALHQERLNQPLQREKPTMYFVNSMSDLFHEDIPDSFLKEVFHMMRSTSHHIFQVLTKREARMIELTELNETPNNVWLGVTVEDRKHGIPRISALCRVKAPIRFLSIEPLLEDLGDIDLTDIHWVIVGGESGPKARIMQPEWILRVKQQCREQKVPFFFKQWGAWGPDGKKRNKKANGRLLLGRTWDGRPL